MLIYIWNWLIIGIWWFKTRHFSQFITKVGFYCKLITYGPLLQRGVISDWWLKVVNSRCGPMNCWFQDHWVWIDEELDIFEYGMVATLDYTCFQSIQFVSKWPYPESDQSTGNPLLTMKTSQRACNWDLWMWWRHELFPSETNIALRPGTGKAWVVKRSWWCLGIVPSTRYCQFSMISQIWEEIHL